MVINDRVLHVVTFITSVASAPVVIKFANLLTFNVATVVIKYAHRHRANAAKVLRSVDIS